MKKFTLITFFLTFAAVVFATNSRQPKVAIMHYANESSMQAMSVRTVPAVVNGSTIDLTSSIDYAQANYYVTAQVARYQFVFQNYDTETPTITLDAPAKSKTSIKGSYNVDLAYSQLVDAEGTQLTLTNAVCELTYVGLNVDLDPEYAVNVVVTASNGNQYTYNDTIAIYAYDDQLEPIILDESTPTSLLQFRTKGSINKTILNGQLYILRDGKMYNAQGGEL